jgi:hypothetical protein
MNMLIRKTITEVLYGAGAATMLACTIAIMCIAVAGWVMNLFKLFLAVAHHQAIDAELVIRIIGVPLAIIGAIAGYI